MTPSALCSIESPNRLITARYAASLSTLKPTSCSNPSSTVPDPTGLRLFSGAVVAATPLNPVNAPARSLSSSTALFLSSSSGWRA